MGLHQLFGHLFPIVEFQHGTYGFLTQTHIHISARITFVKIYSIIIKSYSSVWQHGSLHDHGHHNHLRPTEFSFFFSPTEEKSILYTLGSKISLISKKAVSSLAMQIENFSPHHQLHNFKPYLIETNITIHRQMITLTNSQTADCYTQELRTMDNSQH